MGAPTNTGHRQFRRVGHLPHRLRAGHGGGGVDLKILTSVIVGEPRWALCLGLIMREQRYLKFLDRAWSQFLSTVMWF